MVHKVSSCSWTSRKVVPYHSLYIFDGGLDEIESCKVVSRFVLVYRALLQGPARSCVRVAPSLSLRCCCAASARHLTDEQPLANVQSRTKESDHATRLHKKKRVAQPSHRVHCGNSGRDSDRDWEKEEEPQPTGQRATGDTLPPFGGSDGGGRGAAGCGEVGHDGVGVCTIPKIVATRNRTCPAGRCPSCERMLTTCDGLA